MYGLSVTASSGIVSVLNLFGAPVMQLSGDFLGLAVVFFVLALIAAVVGARGVAGLSMQIAKILIAVFLILAIISLLL